MSNSSEPSWHEAREAAFAAFVPISTESVKLNDSLGRILSTDLHALCDLPTYTTSAMDGYVVSGVGPWKIIGEITAGKPFTSELQNGEAAKITTGSVIPEGSLGVLRWEDAEVNDLEVDGLVKPNQDIRPSGAECMEGDFLVSKGSTITPSLIGFLAAVGHDEIEVFRTPKVCLLTFGDELQFNGVPHNGLVRDSLGPQLPGWIAKLGGEAANSAHIADEYQSVLQKLDSVVNEFDFIITTGGTADGPLDFLRPALNEMKAKWIVDRVRVRPGHPMILAAIKNNKDVLVPILGLPGNPQSALVALFSLGMPVFSALFDRQLPALTKIKTEDELFAPTDFTRLIVGNNVDGKFRMSTYVGSAMLRGMAESNGFAIAPSGNTGIGQVVQWLPLP